MPIFEYLCRECDGEFELLVRGKEQARCPLCASIHLEKKLSGFAVGGQSRALAGREPMGACPSCGDPRGAGACALD
jgi:putative FmdB family regulatory protein